MIIHRPAIGFSILVLLLSACNVNKNIDVPAYAHWSSGSSTINGEIDVGSDAIVDGNLRTINGRIYLANGAQAGNLTTINGNIRLGDGAYADDLQAVNGELKLGKNARAAKLATVNGDVVVAQGAHISGNVGSVNGNLILCGTQLDGELSFYNGSVLLADGSVIHGNVTARKPTRDYQENAKQNEPVVIVGPHATIDGSITFERPGKLYVSDSAVIHNIEGIAAVKFSGAAPAGIQVPVCPAN
jgi:hypothetical protein